MEYFGRSQNDEGQRQLLADHLRNVATACGEFAASAGLPREMGEWAGRLHDLGKYSGEFQAHLLAGDSLLVEHAAHGGAIAAASGAFECAFAIAGHHSGLADLHAVKELLTREERTTGLNPRLPVRERAQRFLVLAADDAGVSGSPARSGDVRGAELKFELRTRMLLSCLVDADRLDAEAWMSTWKTWLRTIVEQLRPGERLTDVLRHIEEIAAAREPSRVTAARDVVLKDALAATGEAPGFFSLTVPAGGGKTLASLAFALGHAEAHGKRRLIFVLPFLTVIEQNAAVIRRAAGETDANRGQVVLEHHSDAAHERDSEAPAKGQAADDMRQRLLTENWDAPIIITTAVQFFHSLFSNRPSAVRKLHRIAGSVLVFDEAQTFPPGMLRPLVTMLRQLVDEYGCSVLFTTATQPALQAPIVGEGGLAPLLPAGALREIASDPAALFRELKRVDVTWPAPAATSMVDIAAAMASEGRALAIVNTKVQAKALYEALLAYDAHAIHLSTRMCSAHRRETVAEIRRRLFAGERCLVASTQLVEAGVDIDFPAVWRAMGPLDSIAQAAGRCNREGRAAIGRVTVFRTEDGRLPGGGYARATKVADGMLTEGLAGIDSPGVFETYFMRLYNASNLDTKDVAGARRTFDFPETANRFRLIDDTTTGVLVPFGGGAAWCQRIVAGEELGRGQLRELQPYLVSLYDGELKVALASGEVTVAQPSGVHVFTREYDSALGLVLAGRPPTD